MLSLKQDGEVVSLVGLSVLRGMKGCSVSHTFSPGIMSGVTLAGMRITQGIPKDRKPHLEGISQNLSSES